MNGYQPLDEIVQVIQRQIDVEQARREARRIASAAGLTDASVERIALVVSELASNLLRYARGGRILVLRTGPAGLPEIRIESHDDGPGIPDIPAAMTDGYSTGGGLGSGLPGARRLADDFDIDSSPAGTRIVAIVRDA